MQSTQASKTSKTTPGAHSMHRRPYRAIGHSRGHSTGLRGPCPRDGWLLQKHMCTTAYNHRQPAGANTTAGFVFCGVLRWGQRLCQQSHVGNQARVPCHATRVCSSDCHSPFCVWHSLNAHAAARLWVTKSGLVLKPVLDYLNQETRNRKGPWNLEQNSTRKFRRPLMAACAGMRTSATGRSTQF